MYIKINKVKYKVDKNEFKTYESYFYKGKVIKENSDNFRIVGQVHLDNYLIGVLKPSRKLHKLLVAVIIVILLIGTFTTALVAIGGINPIKVFLIDNFRDIEDEDKEVLNEKELITWKDVDVTKNKETSESDNVDDNIIRGKDLRCHIYSSLNFKTIDSKAKFNIKNHEDNKDFVLQVEIIDKDANSIYVSPPLYTGEEIKEDYLTSSGNLDTGDNTVTALFNFYNESDGSFYYTANININVNILN